MLEKAMCAREKNKALKREVGVGERWNEGVAGRLGGAAHQVKQCSVLHQACFGMGELYVCLLSVPSCHPCLGVSDWITELAQPETTRGLPPPVPRKEPFHGK